MDFNVLDATSPSLSQSVSSFALLLDSLLGPRHLIQELIFDLEVQGRLVEIVLALKCQR